MKRITSILFLVAGLLLFPAFITRGQHVEAEPVTGTSQPERIREKIFLFTDRTIYAVAEHILFKLDYTIENPGKVKPWSTVVYVELIRQDGQPVSQQKFPLSEYGANGSIPVPDEVPSGVYYLKAYTKWMCNFTADGYAYKPVRIVNPFTDVIASNGLKKDSLPTLKPVPMPADSVFNCSADKTKVKKREKVTLTFSPDKAFDFQREVAVSVCKKGSNNFLTGFAGTVGPRALFAENPDYFPEPRGISISGQVISKETGKEVADARVHLAQLYRNSFYTAYLSGNTGRFLFTFPYSEGTCDFYVEADHMNLPLSVRIDPEYCGKLFSPGAIPFELTEAEKELAKEICINMQMDKFSGMAQNRAKTMEDKSKESVNSFYGKPDRVILTKNYVKLTTVREFFFELVPEFIMETRNRKPFLKLAKSTSLVDFPPLCLIDNIPVTDMEKFLGISMEKIDRIEIIDKAYTAGNLQYNGVVQVFSRSRDLAGIVLSRNSMFFNFTLYSGIVPVVFPDFQGNPDYSRIPDRRNTLYWNPGLKIKPGQEQKISLYAADMQGEYEIQIQGLSRNGESTLWRKTCFVVE